MLSVILSLISFACLVGLAVIFKLLSYVPSLL